MENLTFFSKLYVKLYYRPFQHWRNVITAKLQCVCSEGVQEIWTTSVSYQQRIFVQERLHMKHLRGPKRNCTINWHTGSWICVWIFYFCCFNTQTFSWTHSKKAPVAHVLPLPYILYSNHHLSATHTKRQLFCKWMDCPVFGNKSAFPIMNWYGTGTWSCILGIVMTPYPKTTWVLSASLQIIKVCTDVSTNFLDLLRFAWGIFTQ